MIPHDQIQPDEYLKKLPTSTDRCSNDLPSGKQTEKAIENDP
jgi:hypothetical protein